MPDPIFDHSRDGAVPRLEPGRALVPLTVPAEAAAAPASRIRPDARFVVQLIATATHLPQTRARRHAEPQDAAAAYGGGFRLPANDRVAKRVT